MVMATATAALATSVPPLAANTRLESRSDTLEHWGAALARGDEAAVDRVVRQSRADRIWLAASGQLGPMLG
jgi:hypothetical protein